MDEQTQQPVLAKCAGKAGLCNTHPRKDCLHKMCKTCCKATHEACAPHGIINGEATSQAPVLAKISDGLLAVGMCVGKGCKVNAEKQCTHTMCKSCCLATGDICMSHSHGKSLTVQVSSSRKCSGKDGHCSTQAKKNCTHGMCKACCTSTGHVCTIHGNGDKVHAGFKKCKGKGGHCGTNAKKECSSDMCKICCASTGKACLVHQHDANANPRPAGPKRCSGKGGHCWTNAKKECSSDMCKICCASTGKACLVHQHDANANPQPAGPKKCSGKGGHCWTNAKKECSSDMCKICCASTGKACLVHQHDANANPQPAGPKKCRGKGGHCWTNAKKECYSDMCKICCASTGKACLVHQHDRKAHPHPAGLKRCSGKSGHCMTNAKKECSSSMCKTCCATSAVACVAHGHGDQPNAPNPIKATSHNLCPGKSGSCHIHVKKGCLRRMCKTCCLSAGNECTLHNQHAAPMVTSHKAPSVVSPVSIVYLCCGKSGECLRKQKNGCSNSMCKTCCSALTNVCLIHGHNLADKVEMSGGPVGNRNVVEKPKLCCGKGGHCTTKAKRDCCNAMCKTCCKTGLHACLPHGHDRSSDGHVHVSTAKPKAMGAGGDAKPIKPKHAGPKKCSGFNCTYNAKKDCSNKMCSRCCEMGPKTCYPHDNNTGFEPDTYDVNDAHLKCIMPALHISTAADWHKVADSDVNFRRISFGPDFGIRDDHVIKIADKYPDLKVLEMGSSDTGDGSWVSDTSMKRLVDCCPKLCKLKLESFTHLTDDAASHIINSLKNLEILEISGNDKISGKITDKSLKLLMDKAILPCLQLICVTDQHKVKVNTVYKLRRTRRGMKVIAGETDSDSVAHGMVLSMMGLPYGAGFY